MPRRAALISLVVLCNCATQPTKEVQRSLSLEELKTALGDSSTVPEWMQDLVSTVYECDYVPETGFFGPCDGARNIILEGRLSLDHPVSFLFSYCHETGEVIWLSDSPRGFSRLMREEGIEVDDDTMALLVMLAGVYLTSDYRHWFKILNRADDIPVRPDRRRGTIPGSVARVIRRLDVARGEDGSYTGEAYVFLDASVHRRTLRVTRSGEFTYTDSFLCDVSYE